jgi:DNA polymerase (family X)
VGFYLNEWGLFNKKKKKVAGLDEQEIYEKLHLQYIPPELRENCGEIELFSNNQKERLDLIDYGDLKGDLHTHSDNSDGTMSIREIALHARNFGLDYIAITDHTKSLRLAMVCMKTNY